MICLNGGYELYSKKEKPEEQKKCFHYTNLQPLWAEENLKKGKRGINYE
jgi:hypothetical protein